MRIWSIHPEYLDARGLVALWREALLARNVLAGMTRGYRRHPQLERFRACSDPLVAMEWYLRAVLLEGNRRGYRFDASKLVAGTDEPGGPVPALPVELGQLTWERSWLLAKLARRSPEWFQRIALIENFRPHPLFVPVPGPIARWEKGQSRRFQEVPEFSSFPLSTVLKSNTKNNSCR